MKSLLMFLILLVSCSCYAQPTKVYRYTDHRIIRRGDNVRTPEGDTITILAMDWRRIKKHDFVFAKVIFKGEEMEINLTQWCTQDKILYPGVMTKDEVERAFTKGRGE